MKRRSPTFTAVVERFQCARCVSTFSYGRKTKPRIYCRRCVVLERKDANDFFNNLARQQRLAARMNASLIHMDAAE
jgi:late competence protein required for DNA uptake (superfamily II DNA/RNA helicase)